MYMMIIGLPWFIKYEFWILVNDMIYGSTTHEYLALYEILMLYEILILTWYMWNVFGSIWDIVIDMTMHVRHFDIGNDMILVLNTLVYECCTCLPWLKRNGNWLAVQVLAYWFIWYVQEMDLSALQGRPVSATSMIPCYSIC